MSRSALDIIHHLRAGGNCFYVEALAHLNISLLLVKPPNVFCFTLNDTNYIKALLKQRQKEVMVGIL